MVVAAALGLAACGFGEEGISVSKDDPNYDGAVLFATHCSGCHTLSAAGTQGTGNRGERTQGPNLNQRTETYDDALFAIQNGGFSGAIMPQNIVVGDEAEAVARFVAKYAGDRSRILAAARPRPRPSAERDMLDLKLIRSDPERVKAALARRGAAEQVDELLALDARRRELLPEVENAQAERKTLSKQIGEAKQAGERRRAELMARGAGAEGEDRVRQRRAGAGRSASSTELPLVAPQPARPRRPRRDDRGGRGRRSARSASGPSSTSSRATTSRSAPSWA